MIEEIIGNTEKPNKTKSFSKTLVLVILILFTIVGIIGTFNNSPINMDKFVKFLSGFAWVFSPFVLAVAGGRMGKNYLSAKYNQGEKNGNK